MTSVRRIISGGQTGADQGGLIAAKALGLETGGWMPKGWLTEAGPRPDLRDLYGVQEHKSAAYPPRTKANVEAADATLIFGNLGSSGSRLTLRLCHEANKPVYLAVWQSGEAVRPFFIVDFKQWLKMIGPAVLNIAGNRESKQPGIEDAVREFLVAALRLDA